MKTEKQASEPSPTAKAIESGERALVEYRRLVAAHGRMYKHVQEMSRKVCN